MRVLVINPVERNIDIVRDFNSSDVGFVIGDKTVNGVIFMSRNGKPHMLYGEIVDGKDIVLGQSFLFLNPGDEITVCCAILGKALVVGIKRDENHNIIDIGATMSVDELEDLIGYTVPTRCPKEKSLGLS